MLIGVVRLLEEWKALLPTRVCKGNG